MSCAAPDCSNYDVELEANPDISGVGVLVGFLATAWVTLLILFFHYLAVPDESSRGPLDGPLRQSIQRLFHWNPPARWDRPLRTVVLALSDQQLVTGIALLVGGYTQLGCGLALYHWEIITTLTWFSTTTHFATLPFLQKYLRKNKFILWLRVSLMFALAIMLAIALVPKGGTYWRPAGDYLELRRMYAYPAKCIMDRPGLGFDILEEGIYTIISEVMLAGAFLGRSLRMFPGTRNTSTNILRFVREKWKNSIIWVSERLDEWRWVGMFTALPLIISLTCLISTQIFIDFLRSGAFEILWLLFSLVWGTIRLFHVRAALPDDSNILEEDSWGFGQLVPVLLLLLPVLLVAESCSEMAGKGDTASLAESTAQRPLASLRYSEQGLDFFSSAIPSTNTDTPLVPPARNSIYNHIITLCNHDFRTESWYLGTLYFMLCVPTSTSPLILVQISDWDAQDSGGNIALWIALLIGGAWVALMIIPFYGVTHSLEQFPPKSKQWSLPIIRLITDQRWRYRGPRLAFCSVCLASSLAGLIISILSHRQPPTAGFVTIYFSAVAYTVIFGFTVCFTVLSVYCQLWVCGR